MWKAEKHVGKAVISELERGEKVWLSEHNRTKTMDTVSSHSFNAVPRQLERNKNVLTTAFRSSLRSSQATEP